MVNDPCNAHPSGETGRNIIIFLPVLKETDESSFNKRREKTKSAKTQPTKFDRKSVVHRA